MPAFSFTSTGPFRTLQAFTYQKVGTFLEEYKGEVTPARLNAVYDLSIASVRNISEARKGAAEHSFALVFRNGYGTRARVRVRHAAAVDVRSR